MKSSSLIKIFIILSLFLISCSQENLVGINSNNSQKGSIALKIDKTTTPPEVCQLTALLSRQGYDTLSSSINVGNDSLNVLTFENVPIGGWYLNVNAMDAEGKIIYKGESNVTIIEDETIDVHLTLNLVGNGEGSIKIFIDWGTKWIDYINNPVIIKYNADYDKYGVGACFVFKDDNNYKMWYTGLSENGMGYGYYAYSDDGLSWKKYSETPVLFPDTNGGWDSHHVSPGPVIKEDGTYKMYYSGWSDQYGKWPVGLATSTDGIHWIKYKSNPVIIGSGWNNSIRPQSVIKMNGKYFLYFTGGLDNNCRIGVATSVDGYNWGMYSGNPILNSEKTWEGYGVAFPSVIFDENHLKMVYQGILQSNTSFGFAYSSDGFHWTKSQNNPFFRTENCNNSFNKISFPFFIKINNESRVYYTGIDVYSTDWDLCLTSMFQ